MQGAQEGLKSGHVRTIAKVLRAVDDREPWTHALFSQLHPWLKERRPKTHVIGITGSPGAGKSTVVDSLITLYRSQGLRVGVVAVDPSSPFTGGAILGDRIRMRQHTLDEGVFIRSLATRGALGGLSRSAADSVQVMTAAGFDVVLLETVGVGQDEIDVFKVAQSVVVVLTPGMGDDVQAIKAGILEIADVYLINKADREGAHKVMADLRLMLNLLPHSGDLPPVLESVAIEGKGIAELAAALVAHRSFLTTTDEGRARETRRQQQAFYQLFRDELLAQVEERVGRRLADEAAAVAAGGDPYGVVDRLVSETLRK